MILSDQEANDLRELRLPATEMAASGKVAYTRFDPRFGGTVRVYGRVASSPTGVLMIGAYSEKEWNEATAGTRNGNLCPLSPTEGRR